MMKITKEQFDAQPEALKKSFTVDGADSNSYSNGEENVTGLKNALASEKAARVQAAKERDAFKTGEQKRVDDATKKAVAEAKEKGDWQTVEADYKKREKAKDAEIKELKEKQELAATAGIHEKAVKEITNLFLAPEAMREFAATRIKTVIEDGKPVTRILDKEGNASATTLRELKEEILDTDSLKGILVGSKGRGGGATRPTVGDGFTTGEKQFSAKKSDSQDMITRLEAKGITGMALSDLKVFSQYSQGTAAEVLAQNIDLFNTATKGGLLLRAKSNEGDFSDTTTWKSIPTLVRTRNAYGSGNVEELNLEQLLETSVKVAAGTAPLRIDPGMLRWINKDPKEAGVLFGLQLAEGRLAHMISVAIGALSSALINEGSNYHNAKTGVNSLGVLNKGARKMGDRAQSLVTWLMHSKSAFDLYGAAISNTNRLYSYGTINVIDDGMGRPIVVSDSPVLTTADGVSDGNDSYTILGLVAGGVVVEDNGDYDEILANETGKENLQRTIQAEWSYNVALKGMAWDKANGGKSPNDAAISTGTNWDKQVTSSKDLGGVVIVTA